MSHDFKNCIEFDRNLKVGDKVEARWTNSFREYAVKATIVKLNAKSIRVALDEAIVEQRDGKEHILYPAGREITCPRLLNAQHSIRNCVAPLDNPEKAGPRYKRGEVVEGRGKVTRIYETFLGYSYEFAAS